MQTLFKGRYYYWDMYVCAFASVIKVAVFSTTRHHSSSLLFHVSISPHVHYICGHGADIIQRQILFHSAQAIAWTLFKSGYFSMCGYYSRIYGTMSYMYNIIPNA